MLRSYVLNTGSGWRALPGGLARVAAEDGNVVSMQRGGHSKDAWIVGQKSEDVSLFLLPHSAHRPAELRRIRRDLPSRVADNLFWLGRYIERAENIGRLLRTSLSRVRRADQAELGSLMRLHHCLGSSHSKLSSQAKPTALELEKELLSLMTDEKRADSLYSVLDEVRRVGESLRERLSADMSRLIGQLAQTTTSEEYMLFSEHNAMLSGCLELLSAFSGMERENLTRGPGWLFLSIGRRLERAIYTAKFLREIAAFFDAEEWPLLEQLLEVADSSITYRTRYFTSLQPIAVLEVLMLDETNPRSLDFQLSHLVDLYGKLPRHMEEDSRAVQTILARLRRVDLDDLEYASPNANEARDELQQLLSDLERLLPSWSDNLSNTYFSHVRTFPIAIGQ